MVKDYAGSIGADLCGIASIDRFEDAPKQHDPNLSIPVREGLPNPDVLVDYRVVAYAAGLGEFGYSKVFLTPEFGPFQRFVLLLTDAPLEADPIYEGHLCDRCMRCALGRITEKCKICLPVQKTNTKKIKCKIHGSQI